MGWAPFFTMLITNNPRLEEQAGEGYVEGDALEVLNRCWQLVQEGWFLVSAPLSANNRLNRAPLRSVILSRRRQWDGDDSALIEKALDLLSTHGVLKKSDVSPRELDDYAALDEAHVRSALEQASAPGMPGID